MRHLVLVAAVAALAGCAENQTPGDVCFAQARSELKDPSTATLIKWVDNFANGISIEVRAANGYGGFEHTFARCADGKVRWYKDRVDAMIR